MAKSEIHGLLGKYLGHFRKPGVLAAGHNTMKTPKEEEDEILREAEASIRRLEEAGFGKEEKKPEQIVPPSAPNPTMIEQIEERQKALRRLLGPRKK